MFKLGLKIIGYFICGLILIAMILSLLPIRPTISAIEPRENTEYWNMKGEYKIAYTHLKNTSKQTDYPVIFLHGGPGGYIHSSLFETLDPLTHLGHNVYLYDQSGTGLSDRRKKPKDTTFNTHLSDLYEIIDTHLNAEKVVLIGQSYGGRLAASFAANYPDRVAGVILSAPGGLYPPIFNDDGQWVNPINYPKPDQYEFINASETYIADTSIRNLPLRAIVSLSIAQVFNVRFASDTEVDAALNTMASGFTHNMVCDDANVQPEEGGGGAYSRTGANFYPDEFDPNREGMKNMHAPVIVLHGQCDFLSYASTYEYVDIFPNAEYHFIKDAGHTIWWDQPETYQNSILEFLDKL